MNSIEAKAELKATDDEEPVVLPAIVLDDLTVTDLPERISVEIGTVKGHTVHLDWNERLFHEHGHVRGEADYTWTRKYWYAPIGLEHYLDLVRRAVEVRNREHGDVELSHYDDDGTYIHLTFIVYTHETNLGEAYRHIQALSQEVEEAAESASHEVGNTVVRDCESSLWMGEPESRHAR